MYTYIVLIENMFESDLCTVIQLYFDYTDGIIIKFFSVRDQRGWVVRVLEYCGLKGEFDLPKK